MRQAVGMSNWRPMLATDVAAVHALSQLVHPAYPESRAVFAEKRKLFASGCFVLGAAGTIAGYGFSHPWPSRRLPKLDALLETLPGEGDALFVHDVALHEDARGTGKVVELLRLFEYAARALGLERLALVAVGGTQGYWERAKFAAVDDEALQANARAEYGASAIAMQRAIVR